MDVKRVVFYSPAVMFVCSGILISLSFGQGPANKLKAEGLVSYLEPHRSSNGTFGTVFGNPQAHQPQLPLPGNYSGSACPQSIDGCENDESAVVIERLVDHGDYVQEADPPCTRNVSDELKKSGRAIADYSTPI